MDQKIFEINKKIFESIPKNKILGYVEELNDTAIQKLSIEKRKLYNTYDLMALCIELKKWVVCIYK